MDLATSVRENIVADFAKIQQLCFNEYNLCMLRGSATYYVEYIYQII